MIEANGKRASITFDGEYVTITHRRTSAVGKGTKTIPVAQITGVRWKDVGLATAGFIQFTIPGALEPRTSRQPQTMAAAGDENSVTFSRNNQAQFAELKIAVEQAIAAHHRRGLLTGVSVADELAKLNQLAQSGALTPAEFEAAKARLIGQ
jgi:hypothetical protein